MEKCMSVTSQLESNPQIEGFYQPGEWNSHEAVWLAWPSHRELWEENLLLAQEEFVAFCRAIVDYNPVTRVAHGENLWILVPDEHLETEAKRALGDLPARFFRIPFGDIWLRDTAPIFLMNKSGERASVRFAFNGWGGKYILPHDAEVAGRLAEQLGAKIRKFHFPWILEGGSVEVDGEGTCLTSRQCLLNPNRNRGFTEAVVELGLKSALGVEKVLWLNEGLLNDHTDGHIDTFARFAAPGVVLCTKEASKEDPNSSVYLRIKQDLQVMRDAKGRRFEIVEVPSPGAVYNKDGGLMPASYLNFYISNTRVIVPIYGSPQDDEAVKVIGSCFPDRQTIGLGANAILNGGGAFHCISQQVPI
jgi:agmatine deiminase